LTVTAVNRDMDDDATAVADAFQSLGHEIRVAILEALVAQRREEPTDRGLPFADLRAAAGVRDSGKFNYHLDELVGRFVTETADGYRLTYAGETMAAAALAGHYRSYEQLGPEAVDGSCDRSDCEADAVARYEDGILRVACRHDHLVFRTGIPPSAVSDRALDAVIDFAVERSWTHVAYIRRETCLKCYGRLQTSIRRQPNGDESVSYEATCSRCGTLYTAPPLLLASQHPMVLGLAWEHGDRLRERPPWQLRSIVTDAAVSLPSTNPPVVRVDLRFGEEEARVVLDGAASVDSVERCRTGRADGQPD
jgi:hypothetical protein